MKILIDKMPKQPKDCLFVKWNCEYGWMCKLFGDEPTCYLSKNLECQYLKELQKEKT